MTDHDDDTNEVILDDEKRTLPVRPIPREEPPTPLPAPPGVPRTPSGELLLRLRAPSDAPPDPVQARLDMWGEALYAKLDEKIVEVSTTAKRADDVSGRESGVNRKQDAAIGLLTADMATVKADVATIKAEGSLGLALTQKIVEKVTAKMSPQLGAFVGAMLTAIAAGLYAKLKAAGYLP